MSMRSLMGVSTTGWAASAGFGAAAGFAGLGAVVLVMMC